jgi:putative ABC transport system permease protein
MLSNLKQDLIYASRMLWKNPGFTAVALLTLALGIGANTTVFSVVEALVNFQLPVDDPEKVVFLFGANLSRDIDQNPVSVDDFLDWREQASSFEHLVVGTGGAFNLTGSGEPVRVVAFRVTSGFFPTAGYPLSQGRPFRAEETQPGGDKVVILSHSFRQQRFGGDDVLGQQIALDGESYTIVGVTHEDFFFFNRNTAVYTPLVLERGQASRDNRNLFAMARLKDGVTVEEADAEMKTIARRLEETHPDTNEGWSVDVITLRDNLLSGASFVLIFLYTSITFVLLIACANVANLLLARATVREKEIALRSSLGAARFRIIRQLLTESVLLSAVGGTFGLLLGLWGMRILREMVRPDINIGFLADGMHLNPVILFHTFAISLVAGLIFGLVPALQISKPDLHDTLKEGGRGGSGGVRRRFMRNLLVIAQVSMALALLISAGALIRAFDAIYTADPGFNQNNLLTMRVTLPETGYTEDHEVAAFYRQTLERLETIPGVESATTITQLPLTLFPGAPASAITIEGAVVDDESSGPQAFNIVVSPSVLETMEIELVQGRGLQESDNEDTLPVALVSQGAVRRFWPEDNPIGKRLKLGRSDSDNPWLTIVGITDDVQIHAHSLRFTKPDEPIVFLAHAQNPRRDTSVALRTSVEPASVGPLVREGVWSVDPNQPVDNVMSMDQAIMQIDTQNLFFVRILTGLGVIALIMAGVGIYGVISYTVHHRSHEIGIRMAMGALPRSILMLVIRQGVVLTVIGLFVGLGLAFAMVRFVGSQLEGFQVSGAGGPLTFIGVSLIFLLVAKLASYVPARRAVRVDPVVTLRYE